MDNKICGAAIRGVSDVGPLVSLSNLKWLHLSDTRVIDVEPLRLLANLLGVYLRSTGVSDVEPLSALANLRELNLSGTLVSDIGPLAELSKLQMLDLHATGVSDGPCILNQLQTGEFGHAAILPRMTPSTTSVRGVRGPSELPLQSSPSPIYLPPLSLKF